MPVVTHNLPILLAQEAMPLLSTFLPWSKANVDVDKGTAMSVPEDERPRRLGVDGELLLLVLPDQLEPKLKGLAEADFNVYNRDSSDGSSRRTLLALEAAHVAVEVDAWQTHFPVGARRFFVALVAGNSFVLARHDLGAEEADGFLCGLQGACASSGPNYRPFSAEVWHELEQHRLGLELESPQLLVVQCESV